MKPAPPVTSERPGTGVGTAVEPSEPVVVTRSDYSTLARRTRAPARTPAAAGGTLAGLADRALSIVSPAFDEEGRIGTFLERVAEGGDTAAAAARMTLREVLVVDDGSTDATASLLSGFAGLGDRLRVLTLPRNRGKGAAVRAGMLAATGDLALLTDIDLSTPLDDLGALAAGIDGGADVAIGSRALPRSQVLVHQPLHRELLGKAFNGALRALTGLPFRDTQCGFKLFRLATARALFEHQRIEGFAWDAEICVRARHAGLTVVEVPVRWTNDPRTHVHLLRSSTRMAVDLARLAWLARRPGAAAPAAGARPGGR